MAKSYPPVSVKRKKMPLLSNPALPDPGLIQGEYAGFLILRGRNVHSLNQRCGGGRRIVRKKLPN